MKILAILIVFMAQFASAISQHEFHVVGTPDKITVFQSGANLSMSLKVNVKKGTNIIYIDSLPSVIDENSIRLSSGASTSVMSTDFQMENIPIEEQVEPKNIIALRDSVKTLNYLIRDINNQISVWQGEDLIISSFKLHPETEKGATIQELTALAAYYNKRVTEIRKEILNFQEKNNAYGKDLARLNKKIAEYEATKITLQNYQIIAVLSSEIDGNINLELNTFTPSAGWVPNYELKFKDISSPLLLSYKANVWQGTGRDWKNVSLVLSTRNPNLSNEMPVLYPWYLRLNRQKIDYELSSPLSMDKTANVRTYDTDMKMKVEGIELGFVESKYMTVEFNPSNKYSIKSDNRKQSITLNEVDVPATYEYYCVPKLDTDAFLVAKVSDWGKLNLLPGESYIYFENTYIGKTMINPQSTDDSLSISLGRDKSIVLKREIVEDMTETKFFSKNVVKSYGYVITAKNNRKSEIKMTIEDQFPVSTHEKIEVDLIETSGAEVNKEKGFLTWKVNIPAGKTIEKKFGYKIDSPKE